MSPTQTDARAAVGNSGSNIAIRLAAAGWDVSFVSLVGADRLGELVIADLRRWSVDTSAVVARAGYRTPAVYITVGGDAANSTISNRCPVCGAGRVPLQGPRLDELPNGCARRFGAADVVVFDLVDETALELARSVRARGGSVLYEASLPEATPARMLAT